MSPLSWLDLKIFYLKITKPKMIHHDNNASSSVPDSLTLNHVPLDRDTLLEANGVRTGAYSDGGVSTNLKRDRLDTRSEEATFVCTDSIRTTGSIKFEVFQGEVLVLSGALELCRSNNNVYRCSRNRGQIWRMDCECSVGNRHPYTGKGTAAAASASSVEVYVAGCFSGCPIVLNRTLQLSPNAKRKHIIRKGTMLESIREEENAIQILEDEPSIPTTGGQLRHNTSDDENLGDKDGELSWFNAGVRVGLGISLSVCSGLGIGVGLLAMTYQGIVRNFGGRLLCDLLSYLSLKHTRKRKKEEATCTIDFKTHSSHPMVINGSV